MISTSPLLPSLSFFPSDFGAKGDGVQNDLPAINRMYDAIRDAANSTLGFYSRFIADFGGKPYALSQDINVTGIRNSPIVTKDAVFIWKGPSTGNVLDYTGSYRTETRDVYFYNTPAFPMRACIFQARTATAPLTAPEHTFWRLGADVHCNGPMIHNYSSEVCDYYSPRMANYSTDSNAMCFASDGSNILGGSSIYQTVATGQKSNTIQTLYSPSFRMVNGGGPVYFVDRASHLKVINGYGVCQSEHAVRIYANDDDDLTVNDRLTMLDMESHFEGTFSWVFKVLIGNNRGNVIFRRLKYLDHNPHAAQGIFKTDATGTSHVLIHGLTVDLSGLFVDTFGTGFFDTPAKYFIDKVNITAERTTQLPSGGLGRYVGEDTAYDRTPITCYYGIPASSVGLASGAIWANSNVLTLVP